MSTDIKNKVSNHDTGIEVIFRLPHLIALPEGEYQVSQRLHTLQIAHPSVLGYLYGDEEVQLDCEGRTVVRMFHVADTSESVLDNEFKRCIGITLSAANRFIQWYRFTTEHYQVTEVVREQVSPIILNVIKADETKVYIRDFHMPTPHTHPLSEEEVEKFRVNLLQKSSPPMEHLLLLDAKEALDQFRFREAAMHSWSAIETVFHPFIREKLLSNIPIEKLHSKADGFAR